MSSLGRHIFQKKESPDQTIDRRELGCQFLELPRSSGSFTFPSLAGLQFAIVERQQFNVHGSHKHVSFLGSN